MKIQTIKLDTSEGEMLKQLEIVVSIKEEVDMQPLEKVVDEKRPSRCPSPSFDIGEKLKQSFSNQATTNFMERDHLPIHGAENQVLIGPNETPQRK